MTEKEIKSSAEKIKMPDDVKKRILSKCAEIEKAETSGNSNYTDHVSGVERIQPKRITRIISGLAACAVLAGGIGATGAILHKNGSMSIASEIASEISNKVSPFGDFGSYDFNFFTAYENVNEDYNDKANGNYSADTYAKLAELLNNTEWTEETEPSDAEAKEKVYEIFWKEGNILNMLFVSDSGFVVYQEMDQSNVIDQKELSRKYYSISFDEFESAVQEILASDTMVIEDVLPSVRDELQKLIVNSISNDSVKAFISYNPENFTDMDVPESIKKDNSEIPADMLKNLASWLDGNAVQLCNSPGRSYGLFYIDFKENGKRTASLSFMKEGYFAYQTFDTDTGDETSIYCFKANATDALKALASEIFTDSVKSDMDEEATESLRDEMTEQMSISINEGNYTALLTTSDEKCQIMTNAMMYGMCSWINDNSKQPVTAQDGKILFKIGISNGENCSAMFTFFEEGFYSYSADTEDGTSNVYFFKGDCNEALEILESAMDTEKKHTEDNAAYYLPGFNYEKLGIIENPEKASELQNIFYGYDWAAHEVDELKVYGEKPDFSFYYSVNAENKYNLEVYKNGYIHLYYTDMNNNPVRSDEEKIYKFNNDNIYKALVNYHNGNMQFQDSSEGDVAYSYESNISVSPKDFGLDNFTDPEYYFYDTNLSGTLSEEDVIMILNILGCSFEMENELPDKKYNENKFGRIALSIAETSQHDNPTAENCIFITDKNYLIIKSNNVSHFYKTRNGIDNIPELIRNYVSPDSGININLSTQN